jgi:formate hydrogenlyase transcriptional activator
LASAAFSHCLPFSDVLEHLPVAAYLVRVSDGVVVWYNGRAKDLWGREPFPGETEERFCGACKVYRADGSYLTPSATPVAMALAEGTELRDVDVIIERPDGSRVPVVVNIAPIRDRGGSIVGVANFFNDITEWKRRMCGVEVLLKEAESRLEAMRKVQEQLESKIEERTAFLRMDNMESGGSSSPKSRRNVLEILSLTSASKNAFTEEDIDLLGPVADLIAIAIEKALRHQLLGESPKGTTEHRKRDFGGIVGKSEGITSVLTQVEVVAFTDSTVLILGETGTGKELIAQAIHRLSQRRDRAFVRANCAALPAGLLESELFGHEKGSFTGAISREIGRFEAAQGGTIFLDEVGDIPIELQPKLLRVIQERELERLGNTRTIHVDFRLVAATNRDLRAMIEKGQFRRDLYYRLNIFPITVPPLRGRHEDIPLLVRHFVKHYAERMNKPVKVVRPQDMEVLVQYSWPGNIRELQNVIERSVIISPDAVLELCSLVDPRTNDGSSWVPDDTLSGAEREQILKVLQESDWVIGGPDGAALRLGVKRTTLLYKMRRLGISRPID